MEYKSIAAYVYDDILLCGHNAGFFSVCSVRLQNITDYVNTFKSIPADVDSRRMFMWYKPVHHLGTDITNVYFKDHKTIDISYEYVPIDYTQHYQFSDFSKIDIDALRPFLTKYFEPSDNIKRLQSSIVSEYGISYDNTCVLFYRGNDKCTETSVSSYEQYAIYARSILGKYPQFKLLVQSDETEFIEYIQEQFPGKVVVLEKYIRHMRKQKSTVDKVFRDKNYEYSQYFLAITLIMARSKYVICQSGNCGIWIYLFRGSHKNMSIYDGYYTRKWLDFIE